MAYTNNLIPLLTSNTSEGVAAASTEYSNTYYAYKAMDGTDVSYWRTTTAGVAPCWLSYRWINFSLSPIITKYAIISNIDTDAPKDWKLQGSNDNINWTDLDTQTGITFISGERKEFTFTNTTRYIYYRIYITANNGATTTAIATFELMATVTNDIEVAGIDLQVDVFAPNVQVADVSLQAEIGIPNVMVADVSLQVEFDIPTVLEVTQHTILIEILQYIGKGLIASVPEIATMVLVADHGLQVDDFIIDKTVRDAQPMGASERGCRRVSEIPASDEIVYHSDIADAAADDEILLFRFTDVTQYLMDKTLTINKKSSHSDTANFTLKLPIVDDALSFQPHPGQYVRISLDGVKRFMGIISDADLIGVNNAFPYVFQDVNCISLKSIPSRRTLAVNYAKTKLAGHIVTDINDEYLIQEGFEPAVSELINEGLALGSAWVNDCITIADVFDECASRNGYQWFVDDDFQVHFYNEPAVFEDAPHNLTAGGILKVRELSLKHSIDGYVNKNFVLGGKDLYGDQIRTVNLNQTQIDTIQEITAGTGVWGNVIKDTSIANVLYRPAEAGTAFFQIKITSHSLVVGDYVYNETLGQAFWVATVIDADNFTVNETSYDQAEGDSIVTYPSADDAGQTLLKKQGFMPKSVEYTIDHIFMNPQTKQTINLPRYGIPEGTYNIESVTIKDRGSGIMESKVSAILRDADNFTTQPHPGFVDYYRGL
jgi:hypothetical protein